MSTVLFCNGKMRALEQIAGLKKERGMLIKVGKPGLDMMGAVSGPNEWFRWNHSVILINPIALRAHKLGTGWILRASYSSEYNVNSEDWGISVEKFPVTQVSTKGHYTIYSVLILPYVHFELHLFHCLIMAYMWSTSGGEKSFKKNDGWQSCPGGKNKTKNKSGLCKCLSACIFLCTSYCLRELFSKPWAKKNFFCHLRFPF